MKPASKLFRCAMNPPCGRGDCAACTPRVQGEIVVCDECGLPEYEIFASENPLWETCEVCGSRFCPGCSPVLVSEDGLRMCSLCRKD